MHSMTTSERYGGKAKGEKEGRRNGIRIVKRAT